MLSRFKYRNTISYWLDDVTGTHHYLYAFLRTMLVVIAVIVSIIVVFLCYVCPVAVVIACNNAVYLLLYVLSIPISVVYIKFLFFHMAWEL